MNLLNFVAGAFRLESFLVSPDSRHDGYPHPHVIYTDWPRRPPSRRPSWRPSSEYDRLPAQTIAGTYINRTKLEQLLNREFGRHYKLQVRDS